MRLRNFWLPGLLVLAVGWLDSDGSLLHAAGPAEVECNRVAEFDFTAKKAYTDPFNQIELDVVFTTPSGESLKVPAFWAGGNSWRARYASAKQGIHKFRTECSDSASGLHGIAGQIAIRPYQGENPLYLHGPIRVAPDLRHFQHADGTPFLWLGDTWWMGLCDRLKFPDEFRTLAENRRSKGFNVIQIVAGLYPDMAAFDDRGRNEAGFPWEKDYGRIRPEYFDKADERLQFLADHGFVPCIVGAWGYHLPWLGGHHMKQHWRYLVARWGALPVVWCVAGEINLPYYLDKGFPQGGEPQTAAWEEVIRYVRQINALGNPITAHPTGLPPLSARLLYKDQTLFDFDMLQTGHGQTEVLAPTIRALRASYDARPKMPVVNGEVAYEALLGRIPARIPRLMYWTCMLAGAAGHTYGANGIWQLNRPEQPYGKSPHGGTYGPIPWNEAMNLSGSEQLGLAKRLFEKYPWQRFEPHSDWASWAANRDNEASWGDWIWFPEGNPAKHAPAAQRWFRRSFELPRDRKPTSTRWRLTADDAFTAYLNGQEIGSFGGWTTGQEYAIAVRHLRPGKNVLSVRATNGSGPKDANPAGVASVLEVDFDRGPSLAIRTDDEWRCANREQPQWQNIAFDDSDWMAAQVVARFGEGPWGRQVRIDDEFVVPYAAGLPEGVRIIYAPKPRSLTVQGLKPDQSFLARYFDPLTGSEAALGTVRPDANGSWTVPPPSDATADWVVVLEPGDTGR